MRTKDEINDGDVVEFTSRSTGERITAQVLLASFDKVLLDVLDGQRPVLCRVDDLTDVSVFLPESAWHDELRNPPRHLSVVA